MKLRLLIRSLPKVLLFPVVCRASAPSSCVRSVRLHPCIPEHMSVEQLRQQLASQWQRVRDLFVSWDTDGNGRISRSEWAVALPKALGSSVSASQALALFDQFDTDRSGDVDFDELHALLRRGADIELEANLRAGAIDFDRDIKQRHEVRKATGKQGSNVVDGLQLQNGSLEAMMEALRAKIASSMQRTFNLFREWDVDGNGSIDRDEFARALAVLGLEPDARNAVALFDALDDDKSGSLEFSELNARLRQRIDVAKHVREREQRRAGKPAEARQHSSAALEEAGSLMAKLRRTLASNLQRTMDLMRSWDTDGSGLIDKAEFSRAVRKLVPEDEFDPRVADALFDAFDADRSGDLEFSELHAKLRALRTKGRGKQGALGRQQITTRIHAMQDDVVGRTRLRSDADRVPLATNQGDTLPPLPMLPRRPPPVPVLPLTSPARHRRIGRRMPLRTRDQPTEPAPAQPINRGLPPLSTQGGVGASTYARAGVPVPGSFPVISQGFRWNWNQ